MKVRLVNYLGEVNLFVEIKTGLLKGALLKID